jgi:spore coat polysaccharide biosynthesis protein SpsF (cytidylyltransferase family)/aryl-alcohol dehydrogenase-like predicted oxidoreductase
VTSIAILQARTNSTRLPGKVLLPVGGLPLAVLAAKRAGNTGRKVIVATSDGASDDALSKLVLSHGIQCVRGSLENTLQRFVHALEGYPADTLVFRLTADNVFPDGMLLDAMERVYTENGLDYLCCNGARSGLPYGMSAELMRAGHLREAAATTSDAFDQEHVTPYVRRLYGEAYFEKYKHLAKGHYRCTVDCLDDYLAIQQVFSVVADAVQAPALDLIERLDSTTYRPLQSQLVEKLVLGTAQLGSDYGIANQQGKPDQHASESLIKIAIANGVSSIDTARVYGNSEEVIGHALKSGWSGRAQVITKLSPLLDCPRGASRSVVKAFVDASVYQSCAALQVQKLDTLLLHRASHLQDWAGGVWHRLQEHQSNGLIKTLGVSVQTPDELEMALANSDVGHIQMPLNVLDWRWDKLVPYIEAAKTERRLTINVRSALLQGLLTSSSPEHWRKARVNQAELVIEWLAVNARRLGCDSIADFCLRYVRSLNWVDGVVLGMETMEQLVQNTGSFSRKGLSAQAVRDLNFSRPKLDENSLNPANWSQ